MIPQSIIASVIDAQKKEITIKPEGLIREVIDQVPVVESFASIITGIRRCGKSTLMLQTLKKIEEKVLFFNFEDIRLSGFETSDFTRLNSEIETARLKFFFLTKYKL